jgi:hypothetical protein
MRPDFNNDEYQAGFDHMRQAMLDGIRAHVPSGQAQSFTIGAFCALVMVIWQNRKPGLDRAGVGAMLATVLSDVLRGADDQPEVIVEPIGALLEAFHATVVACSPPDRHGRPMADGDVVLSALSGYAAELLASVPNPQQRQLRMAEFALSIEDLVQARLGQPSAFTPVVIDGGRA